MRSKYLRFAILAAAALIAIPARAQAPSPPSQGPVRITLDEAIQLALAHNHALKAARTTIQQNESEEITANLRPNPVLTADAQFLPIFQPNKFSEDYINTTAQFDLGISYLFERGKKRQHRLQAARDATAQTRSLVADNERTLVFSTASQFVNVQLAESTLDLAEQDLKSFQSTVDISESRYKIGDMSQGDFLKIHLQLLQFQQDVANARLARVQALVGLRQFLGYESVPADFDVAGKFDYEPVSLKLEELQAKAIAERPDLRAARQGVTAANSQYLLAKANGKVDVTGTFNYDHIADTSTGSFFGSFQIPIFNRNQGEIARTRFAITQAEELQLAASDQVMSDVSDAYEGVRDNDEVVVLFRSGYLDEARLSRDISEYAYRRGAASLLDFLDAERTFRATQLAYRQQLASYLLAVEQLREAVGTRALP
ncbi:MAG TPA: TolC family protein [Candidatus Sulfotelmatobacter sp.]|nr:TolC family protein [Candidatus Sulfotelmatobacter sp.]